MTISFCSVYDIMSFFYVLVMVKKDYTYVMIHMLH